MAMTKCKECGKEVSTSADTCPHCGIKKPGASAKEAVIGGVAILIAMAWGLTNCTGGEDEAKSEPAQTAAEEAACRQDLRCRGDKYNAAAGVYCEEYVEKLSSYAAKWTDGMLEPKFSKFGWKDKDKGYITYVGDKVQFQNGFGAWKNYVYECDFDPDTNTVLDVRAGPGRL